MSNPAKKKTEVKLVGCQCPRCLGRGLDASRKFCPVCAGRGQVSFPLNATRDCSHCQGKGKQEFFEGCETCNETGIAAGIECRACKGAKKVLIPVTCGVCCGSARVSKDVNAPFVDYEKPIDNSIDGQFARVNDRLSKIEKDFQELISVLKPGNAARSSRLPK